MFAIRMDKVPIGVTDLHDGGRVFHEFSWVRERFTADNLRGIDPKDDQNQWQIL